MFLLLIIPLDQSFSLPSRFEKLYFESYFRPQRKTKPNRLIHQLTSQAENIVLILFNWLTQFLNGLPAWVVMCVVVLCDFASLAWPGKGGFDLMTVRTALYHTIYQIIWSCSFSEKVNFVTENSPTNSPPWSVVCSVTTTRGKFSSPGFIVMT